MRFSAAEVLVHVPAAATGSLQSDLRSLGEVLEEDGENIAISYLIGKLGLDKALVTVGPLGHADIRATFTLRVAALAGMLNGNRASRVLADVETHLLQREPRLAFSRVDNGSPVVPRALSSQTRRSTVRERAVAGKSNSSSRKPRRSRRRLGPYANIVVTVAANAAVLGLEVLAGYTPNIVVLVVQCICIALGLGRIYDQ